MTEIKPRLVEGEPVCNEECESMTAPYTIPVDCYMCDPGEPCIPGLRAQRDEARPAPALEWKTGKVPEGVEVVVNVHDSYVVCVSDGHELFDEDRWVGWFASQVTRWIPLADLLKMIGGGE